MSTRPSPAESPRFDDALALARAGNIDGAIAQIAALTRGRGASARGSAANALAQVARHAARTGSASGAERALEQAVRLAPDFADLRYQYACVLIGRFQRGDARKQLQHALRINPGYLGARVELALLDAREGRLAESLDTLRSLGDAGRLAEPRAFRQGLRRLEEADWDEAEALFKQALQLSDAGVDETIAGYQRLVADGDPEGAARLVRHALRTREGYADLHHLLGIAEFECGHFDDALASLGRALELHPDFHAARVAFARTLEALGDAAQAVEQIALVLQHDPEHAQALELYELWTRRRGHHEHERAQPPGSLPPPRG